LFLRISNCISCSSTSIANSLDEHQPTPELDAFGPHRTAAKRLDELAQILSAGLRRILPEQSSTLLCRDPNSLVDFSPLKSGVRRRELRNRVGG